MAGRTRDLNPGFFLNENWPSPLAQILFAGLLCHADREGRLEDRPRKLKPLILPNYDCDVDELLDLLCDEFIVRYECDGKKYIQVINFLKYQRHIHDRETESVIPPLDTEGATKAPPRWRLGAAKAQPRCAQDPPAQGQVQDQGIDQEKGGAGGKNKPRPNPSRRHRVTVEQIDFPHGMDTPECREAVVEWLAYKGDKGQPYKKPKHLAYMLSQFSRDGPTAFIEAVQYSMGCNYAGIVRPSNKGGINGRVQGRLDAIDASFVEAAADRERAAQRHRSAEHP